MTNYRYYLATLDHCESRDSVFVPNVTADTTVKIWQWLDSGQDVDKFPVYEEGDAPGGGGPMFIDGIDESAWLVPADYREAYCPKDALCIVRKRKR